MDRQRLEYHLENWRDWMMYDNTRLGYPKKSLMIASGGESSYSAFEDMCEDVDATCAIAIDAIINSLSRPRQVAINHQWLRVAHHYPTHELDLDEAYTEIMRLADKRGVV